MNSILIGIIANDAGRFSQFPACVHNLDTTGLNTKVEWLIGGDWCGARNSLARMTLDSVMDQDGSVWPTSRSAHEYWLHFLDDEAGRPRKIYFSEEAVMDEYAKRYPDRWPMLEPAYSHLWFMDDDHAFPPSLLQRLVRHDLPLVTPVCLTRIAPFPPVCYTDKISENMYLPIILSDHPEEALVEIQVGGCAGMLIRRDVLEAVEPPWFEYTDRSEDIVFCEKAKAAGFKLFADLSARLGHITTAVVWPAVDNGKWVTGITVGRDLQLAVDLATEQEPA